MSRHVSKREYRLHAFTFLLRTKAFSTCLLWHAHSIPVEAVTHAPRHDKSQQINFKRQIRSGKKRRSSNTLILQDVHQKAYHRSWLPERSLQAQCWGVMHLPMVRLNASILLSTSGGKREGRTMGTPNGLPHFTGRNSRPCSPPCSMVV